MSTSFNQIQALYRKYRLLVFTMLLLLIAALAMIFIRQILTLPLLAVCVIFHLTVLRPCQKQYSDAVTLANLEQTICKRYDAGAPQKKGGSLLTAETLKSASLMPCGDDTNAPLLCWELHGEKNGLRFSLCDATIPQNFKLAQKGRKRVHFDSGVWTHMELPADTQKQFKLLDETSVPTPIRMEYFSQKWNYETGSIDDSDISQRFVLYRPKGTDQGPSTAFLRSLKSLVKYTPGYVALSVRGDQMDIFIRGRFLARPVSISQKPTEELLTFDPFPELSYLIDLAGSVLH